MEQVQFDYLFNMLTEISEKLDNKSNLRDYFAGQVLASHMVTRNNNLVFEQNEANRCYKVADAMLKAREES